MSDFIFKKVPPIKCKHCGKQRGDHRATTFECPKGMKGRAGTYNMWGPEVFEPKLRKPASIRAAAALAGESQG